MRWGALQLVFFTFPSGSQMPVVFYHSILGYLKDNNAADHFVEWHFIRSDSSIAAHCKTFALTFISQSRVKSWRICPWIHQLHCIMTHRWGGVTINLGSWIKKHIVIYIYVWWSTYMSRSRNLTNKFCTVTHWMSLQCWQTVRVTINPLNLQTFTYCSKEQTQELWKSSTISFTSF